MKKLLAALLAVALLAPISACADSTAPAVPAVAQEQNADIANVLNNADTVRAKQKAFSLGEHWDIYADNELVATIDGEEFRILETYTMRDMSGNVLYTSEQNLDFNMNMSLHNHVDNRSGSIEQNLMSMMVNLRVYRNGNQTGELKQNLSLNRKALITDMNGVKQYDINARFMSLGADFTIENVGNGDAVSMIEAIFTTIVFNKIISQSANNSSNSSK